MNHSPGDDLIHYAPCYNPSTKLQSIHQVTINPLSYNKSTKLQSIPYVKNRCAKQWLKLQQTCRRCVHHSQRFLCCSVREFRWTIQRYERCRRNQLEGPCQDHVGTNRFVQPRGSHTVSQDRPSAKQNKRIIVKAITSHTNNINHIGHK